MRIDRRIYRYVNKAVQDGVDREDIFKKVRDIIKDIPDFNIREKARLYVAAKKMIIQAVMQEGDLYKKQLRRFEIDCNKVTEHKNARMRKDDLKIKMRFRRAGGQVFYLCSEHPNCAKDHKDYQGKIYVDRFWRNTLEDDPEMLKAVEAYIKNHDIKTVQWVCSDPVYMIRRPYCKHKMIPLDLKTVLKNSLNKIKRSMREGEKKEAVN